jgi:threonine aldolase
MSADSHRTIDLRSDTVTRPTPGMREAMASADVGDDVFGDDPTVNRLEETAARLLGKAAAVFMPSGTMSNQVAIRSHTEPGDEILLDANAHIFFYEAGAPAALSGVMCRCLPGVRGVFSAADIAAVIRPQNVHFPRTRLVCIENTHNSGGGRVWPLSQIEDVAAEARKQGLMLHLDGARLWNAVAATGIAMSDYARPFDSVSVCFSKGLGAPMGSALAGTKEFAARARRFRKQFGGGLRQAGVVAAAALYALDHHRDRLRQDHEHAQRLAGALALLPGVQLLAEEVETNIVIAHVTAMPALELVRRLAELRVSIIALGPERIRAVTHLDVSSSDLDLAIRAFQRVLS